MQEKIVSPSLVVIPANFNPSFMQVVNSFKAVTGYRDRRDRFGEVKYKTPICILGSRYFLCVSGANNLIGYVLAKRNQADIFEMDCDRDIDQLKKNSGLRENLPGVFFETSETLSPYRYHSRRREPSSEEIMFRTIRRASTIGEVRKSLYRYVNSISGGVKIKTATDFAWEITDKIEKGIRTGDRGKNLGFVLEHWNSLE